VTLELRPEATPVEVLRRYPASEDLRNLARRLPAWTAPELQGVRRETLAL
jgi:hypothetical protein